MSLNADQSNITLIANNYLFAVFIGYVVWGIVSDWLSEKIIKAVWKKTEESYSNAGDPIPPNNKSTYRNHFAWAPKIIGILERFYIPQQ